eukprot:SAG11_NODE_12371_length_706_cov_4.782537_1_plen_59_part_10
MEELGGECTSHPSLLTVYRLIGVPNICIFFYMHATYSCTADPKKRTLRMHHFFYWDPII